MTDPRNISDIANDDKSVGKKRVANSPKTSTDSNASEATTKADAAAAELFGELLFARRIGSLSKAKAACSSLRRYGWSVVSIEPKTSINGGAAR